LAAKIELDRGDRIEVGKAFVSGKDRITINGQVVFEGKLPEDYPMDFGLGDRRCQLTYHKVSTMLETRTIHVKVYEGDALVVDQLYDQNGQPVGSSSHAKANSVAQLCGMLGAGVGVAVIMSLNMATGSVPGGAIGGAIGGGLGAAVGYGIGKLLA